MATPQPGAAPPNANKISIITKSEIRYEGILYHINPQDQNITLCNVKSFGTEGRRPGDEIAPSPQVHEYIIFRGSDIKDLKVIEAAQQPQPDAPTTNTQPEKTAEQSAPKEQNRPQEKQDLKMNQGSNQEEFDFQAMREKFHQFTLDHKQPDLQSNAYNQKDFFDSLSTSTAEKTRDVPFDRIAQKKVDKETFGSEYVDTATQRGRGGYRRGGGYRGGQNRRYGGGQNRGYGGQNRNRGYDNQEGYGQQGGYGGHGGQGGYGGHGGQGGYGDNQGGYGHNQGGYGHNQGGYGGQGNYRGRGGYNQGGRGGQSGPRYYKTYQSVNHNQDQGEEGGRGGPRKYGNPDQF